MSFTHLHVATAFSAHYGVSWPEDLVSEAKAHGAPALACTDRDGLYGAVKHVKACLAHGIAPILGVDLAVVQDSDAGPRRRITGRVVVLAHGGNAGAGYRALCRLISDAHAHTTGKAGGAVPVGVTRQELAARATWTADRSPVLTVLLGPQSDVGLALRGRRYTEPRTKFREWAQVMPEGTLVAEIVTHQALPEAQFSTGHAVKMLKLARNHGVPAILSNAVRYLDEDGAATADVLDAARALSSLQALDATVGLQSTAQAWLKLPAAMHRLAREVVRAADLDPAETPRLLRDTEALAGRCQLDPADDLGWKQPQVPETAVIGLSQDPMLELAARCEAGLTRRYPGAPQRHLEQLRQRLAMETGIIKDLGFASYFLTVAEVSRMITGMGIRAAARGSGASSLVNFLLDVSHVEPLSNGLLFERFLSLDRSTLPDIDIDIESARRHEVYHAIFKRFGQDRVTLMSMQNGYRARGAVRDAGLALGMDDSDVDTIAKQLWRFSASTFREALAEKPELRDFAAQVEEHGAAGQLDLLVDITERLDRLPRHIAMHPCGVILGNRTLLDRTPVQPSALGLPMSQFDKHDMDPMGMLKLDVLGVRMQSAIAYAVKEIQRIHPTPSEVAQAGNHPAGKDGREPSFIGDDGAIDMNAVPLDDEATFELIRSTHTLGCFQIESPGQRELVGKLAPREFNDLVIDISLFRPGPMQSDMVRPFLEYRHGFAQANYPHPSLKPALEETHGVVVFHEQLLRVLDTMTGCGLSQADVLRRRLSDSVQLPAIEAYFRDSAAARGYSSDVIDHVWQTVEAFGSFGFCKAHGAAFALPTYQSAWLKAHHPEAFLAGIFEHDPGMYELRLLVAEARRMGIPILPVDINASSDAYRVERITTGQQTGRLGIRLSMKGIYGLSESEMKRIIAYQPYASIEELRTRARVSRRNIGRLAELGALDSLQRASGGRASRTDLVRHLQQLADAPTHKTREQVHGQLLLPLEGDPELAALRPELPEPTPEEKIRSELRLTKVDASGHLMDSYRPLLDHLGVTKAEQLLGLRNGTEVLVAGIRVATQTPPMRGGRRVVFISLDDGTGCADASFFTEAQDRTGPLLFRTQLMLIHGKTRRTGPRGITVQALEAWDLNKPETLPGPRHLANPSRAKESPRPRSQPADPLHTSTGVAKGVPEVLENRNTRPKESA
jgi:error-prone DNA polymerase